MYIITYPNGDAAWFENLAETMSHLEFDATGLRDCEVYYLAPNGAWLDASREIEREITAKEEEMAWDIEHEAYVSSPEKTGRI